MRKILIADATDDQLRQFATEILQVEVAPTAERGVVLALIQPAWGADFISLPEIDDDLGDDVQHEADVVFNTGRDDGPTTSFTILQTSMPGGKHPASPCVNGKMLVMQRNVRIDAPYAFYLALKNAQCGAIEQGEDQGNKPGALINVTVTNYPLSDVILPPQAEIDAWHARNGSRLLGGEEAPRKIAA